MWRDSKKPSATAAWISEGVVVICYWRLQYLLIVLTALVGRPRPLGLSCMSMSKVYVGGCFRSLSSLIKRSPCENKRRVNGAAKSKENHNRGGPGRRYGAPARLYCVRHIAQDDISRGSTSAKGACRVPRERAEAY